MRTRPGKQKAQALLSDRNLSQAWTVYTQFEDEHDGFYIYTDDRTGYSRREYNYVPVGYTKNEKGVIVNLDGSFLTGEQNDAFYRAVDEYDRTHKQERILVDVVAKLVQYGSISEAQFGLVEKMLFQINHRSEIEAQHKAEAEAAAPCPSGRIEIAGLILSTKEEDGPYGRTTKMLVQADSGYKVFGNRPSKSNAGRGQRIRFTATVTVSAKDSKFGYFSRPVGLVEIATVREVVA